MQKNGKLKVSEARCSCGGEATTIRDGVPLCAECESEYEGEEKVAFMEPTD